MKKTTKQVKEKKNSTEVVIRVESSRPSEEDLKPQVSGGKYMIPKTWINETQVIQMVSKTPPQHIYTRPGKGGGKFTYVTGVYVTKILNFVFGFNWDFEVLDHGKEGGQVWVKGKLTVKDDKGHTIVKSQFGRADIKIKKDSKEPLDFGNDLKAASTDALKKCASLLGIASDVYGKAEFKEEANVNIPTTINVETPKEKITPSVSTTTLPRCKECGEEITPAEFDYSTKLFGRPLCRKDQVGAKRK